uniref:Uncharacterized protein n=1 Tax=Timema monikensis TaxID=170555 RepID=A0A7R9EBR5_9NEOP|nr:unnamed protein product [Timema monikensis]
MVQFKSVAQSTCGVRFRQLTTSTTRACALSSQRVIGENGRQTSVPTKRDQLKGVRQLTMDVHVNIVNLGPSQAWASDIPIPIFLVPLEPLHPIMAELTKNNNKNLDRFR